MIVDANGFIGIDVSDEVIAQAKAIRASRDATYGNIFPKTDTDLRWVGEIGEIIFDSWFRSQSTVNCQWLTDEPAGKADFILGSAITVGVKTVKRKVPMQPGYTAQITAQHVNEPVEYYFFACYEGSAHETENIVR